MTITRAEEEYLKEQAYLPEHIPGYVQSITGGEPFLLDQYLCYLAEGVLIFVGYPLNHSPDRPRMEEILREAVIRFQPRQAAILTESVPPLEGEASHPDSYYKIDLADFRVPSKVRNMVRRAGRDLKLATGGEFTDEHRVLISDFLGSHHVDEETRWIYERIPDYAASGPSVLLFHARNASGKLVAFDIAEFGARDWAFYMFNFRSTRTRVPGASDLLLQAVILEARRQGKSSLNLGLGINDRVAFFKKKWGAFPFLRHQVLVHRPKSPSLFRSLLEGLKAC
jgi:hypothetical protein